MIKKFQILEKLETCNKYSYFGISQISNKIVLFFKI